MIPMTQPAVSRPDRGRSCNEFQVEGDRSKVDDNIDLPTRSVRQVWRSATRRI